tara:strand:- start:6570 stop:6752 length:183 start_codon:yes stop_codon:yes gene_type:complete
MSEPMIPLKRHHTQGWVTKKEWVKHWYNFVVDNIKQDGRSGMLMALLERAASDLVDEVSK